MARDKRRKPDDVPPPRRAASEGPLEEHSNQAGAPAIPSAPNGATGDAKGRFRRGPPPLTPTTEQDTRYELHDVPVLGGRRWYLTIGALATALGSLVGATYAVINYVELKPLQQRLSQEQSTLDTAQKQVQELTANGDSLRQHLTAATKDIKAPIPVIPEDDSTVFGTNVVLGWQYGQSPATDDREYFIELFDAQNGTPKVCNIPAGARVNFTLQRASGSYFWRVRRGNFDDRGVPIPLGPWSRWSNFQAYPSLLDRVKDSSILRVATKPLAEDDAFVFRDVNGRYSGYEVELVNWLAQRLTTHLSKPIRVEFVQRLWAPDKNLLQSVNDGDVDMAVRCITKTTQRQLQYRRVRFSTGYAHVAQIFVALSDKGQFPSSLHGKVVGVKGGSTNELAAAELKPQYGFTVNATFENYADLRKALRDEKIDYALVDDVLMRKAIRRGEIHQFGPALEDQLKEFNVRRLGEATENYAIAVHTPGNDTALLNLINTWLESAEGQSHLQTLQKKYLE